MPHNGITIPNGVLPDKAPGRFVDFKEANKHSLPKIVNSFFNFSQNTVFWIFTFLHIFLSFPQVFAVFAHFTIFFAFFEIWNFFESAFFCNFSSDIFLIFPSYSFRFGAALHVSWVSFFCVLADFSPFSILFCTFLCKRVQKELHVFQKSAFFCSSPPGSLPSSLL